MHINTCVCVYHHKIICDNYFCGSMLDASDAQRGMYFPCSFGSQPIHLTLWMSTSSAGNLIVNKTLVSSDTDFFTRIEIIFIVFSLRYGLQSFHEKDTVIFIIIFRHNESRGETPPLILLFHLIILYFILFLLVSFSKTTIIAIILLKFIVLML